MQRTVNAEKSCPECGKMWLSTCVRFLIRPHSNLVRLQDLIGRLNTSYASLEARTVNLQLTNMRLEREKKKQARQISLLNEHINFLLAGRDPDQAASRLDALEAQAVEVSLPLSLQRSCEQQFIT